MAWTTKQIYDLDNSMVAAQNVSLGTALNSYLITNRVVAGNVTPTLARQVVTSGLTTVDYALCSFSGSPSLNHTFAVASAGSVAGTVILNSYSLTAGSVIAASTGSFVNLTWIAVGS